MLGGGADQPLNGLPNVDINLEDLGNSAYRSDVTVTVEGPEDIAEYFCVASNGLSDDAQSSTITLTAAGKLSSIAPSLSLSSSTSLSLSLSLYLPLSPSLSLSL